METGEPILKPGKTRRFKRGIYILPSLFTVGSLVCGYIAILATLKATGMDAEQGRFAFDTAAKAIGWAVLFDGFDGRIARLTNSSSDFGREFDSLADVITFGVAPAFLAFAWGVRPVEEVFGTQLVQHLRDAGWVVTFAFLICGAARLARFNVDTGKPASDRKHFVGLPIPAAAGVIAALIHCIKWPVNDWVWSPIWLTIVGVLGFLMVSKMRYPSFKSIDLRRRRPYVAIILIGIVIYAIWTYSEPVLLALALVYAFSGPVSKFVSKIRPNPPTPQEVHAS
ncbi:MAG TPA: CDP-diacylglycerol--serine O-phosphatidyltransferase [Terriglobia bacterium]|nr:CDP-diacylglycerol--serine O-phosphatidyltransferase [Terriglobia bacterium]